MKANFRMSDKPFFYHATAAAIRYNFPVGRVYVTPEPEANGVKLIMLDEDVSMLLYETMEGLVDGDPIIPVKEIREAIVDKVAVFHVTEGVLSIYDVKAFQEKKASEFIRKREIKFDSYSMEVYTLSVTDNFGSYYTNDLRWLATKDRSPLYAEISLKVDKTETENIVL